MHSDSDNGLGSSAADSTAQGVRADQRGEILQRGGEELRLQQLGDRFTTRLVSADPAALDALRPIIQPLAVRPVAQGQLLEWTVPAGRLEAALASARAAAEVRFASHVYSLAASPQTVLYLTDQITVQFGPGILLSAVDAIATPLGLQHERELPGLDQAFILQVTPAAEENPIKLANRLASRTEVLLAEPNVVVESAPLYRPGDTLYAKQWHLHHQGGPSLSANSHIAAERAWDLTRGSRSVVIAITDDAFDLDHPDLQGLGKIVGPQDLRSRDALPLPSEAEDNHGTAVAGLALAEENGSGVVGVAPGCSLMPIQTTGFLDDETIEQMFDWATEQGAAVISCSWSPAAVYFPLSLRQRSAITRAATRGRGGKGCVILFSAGNANRPVNGKVQEQNWPNNALRGVTEWLGGFAIHPDVIAVSASTSLNRKAAYSNWGSHVAIAAPSNNGPPSMALPRLGQVSTGPPVKERLPGLGMVTSDRVGSPGYSRGDYASGFGGTSSACPVVAGVAGLMLSVNPDLTAQAVKQILQDTADKIIDETPDPQLGLSYGTYDSNGHSRWFGYGKVNAYRAVAAARDRYLAQRQLTETLTASGNTTLDIPDGSDRGIRSPIEVSQSGELQDIQVYIEADHEFLGDLSFTLLPPSGGPILLQGRTLGRQTRLRQRYTLSTTPTLCRLLNQPVRGRWQLQVIDHAPKNVGQLRYWEIRLGL
ncbi:S8 family serine peptidase [Romeria aff. gracilis LEGE 07310]|uniref:S8 family serine peptidase n=1 Tax=Vasconcelosia minhoensis LEGE 07310 TaxID=915328 RepID=A0A8J7ALG0_9CYAN|nr:S8 family serine peptidase [Romeria gracilis]MBE9077190.1 S8 family serine peptidase [Romeria aff. gracilis LEGE 07310]